MLHITSLLAGFLLDLMFGDPYWLPHPIRFIGNLIAFLQKNLLKETASAAKKRRRGRLLVLLVLLITGVLAGGILWCSKTLHPLAGVVVESIMCYQILATKCLKTESMKVYNALEQNDVEGARSAVSMIVGRDTQRLDETGMIKATVETIAENTSDGVIAPLFYLILGGPVLGFLYKAVNTMDSMVGYKNEKYQDFGRCAALLDDVVNYLPSRIAAFFMIVSAYLCGFNGKQAALIYKRDRYCHASPNSAQTEAVAAGALEVQLAGDAWYFGKKKEKPTIGDDIRPIEKKDIVRTNKLLYTTAILMEILGVLLLTAVHLA